MAIVEVVWFTSEDIALCADHYFSGVIHFTGGAAVGADSAGGSVPMAVLVDQTRGLAGAIPVSSIEVAISAESAKQRSARTSIARDIAVLALLDACIICPESVARTRIVTPFVQEEVLGAAEDDAVCAFHVGRGHVHRTGPAAFGTGSAGSCVVVSVEIYSAVGCAYAWDGAHEEESWGSAS